LQLKVAPEISGETALECGRLRLAYARNREAHFFPRAGRALIFAVVLAAVTIFAYRPAWHGGFLWDDDAYIINNELLTAPHGWQRIWFSLDSPVRSISRSLTAHFASSMCLWGLKHDWLSLGEPSASCWQCSSGMGGGWRG